MAVTGVDKLIASLKDLDAKARRKVIVGGLRDGAKIIAEQARTNAPDASGDLRAAIKVRAGKRKKGRINMLVLISKNVLKRAYMAAQEWGWRAGAHRHTHAALKEVATAGESRKQIPGTHFMANAVKAKGNAALQAMHDRMAELLAGKAGGAA